MLPGANPAVGKWLRCVSCFSCIRGGLGPTGCTVGKIASPGLGSLLLQWYLDGMIHVF